jgi:glycosyltransferase involved in cell wall biosynthesis
MKLSIIVPTCGRPSLAKTLASLVAQPLQTVGPNADEVLVIGQAHASVHDYAGFGVRYLPRTLGYHYGCEERTTGIAAATGTHLGFLDDDDTWNPGARAAIADAMNRTPLNPVLFRMEYPNGRVLWKDQKLICGNVSTQMILVPNDRTRLGKWSWRREGDYDFLRTMKWPTEQIMWRQDIIARIGHDDAT